MALWQGNPISIFGLVERLASDWGDWTTRIANALDILVDSLLCIGLECGTTCVEGDSPCIEGTSKVLF